MKMARFLTGKLWAPVLGCGALSTSVLFVSTASAQSDSVSSTQADPRGFVKLSLLNTGTLQLTDAFRFEGGSPNQKKEVTCLVGLIEHPKQRKFLLFDNGLPQDFQETEESPDWGRFEKYREQYQVFEPKAIASTSQLLEQKGIPISRIRSLILSHYHYDHAGDISAFPKHDTELVMGEGVPWIRDCVCLYGQKVRGLVPEILDSDTTRHIRTVDWLSQMDITESEVLPDWLPFSEFGLRMCDWFGDGSLIIIDGPGHVTGHIMCLCRLENGMYALLTGDAVYDCNNYSRQSPMNKGINKDGSSVDYDPILAMRTIRAIHSFHHLDIEPTLVIPSHLPIEQLEEYEAKVTLN